MACSSFFPKSTSALCLLFLIILLFHPSDYSCVFMNKKIGRVGFMKMQHRKLLASSEKKNEILEVNKNGTANSGKGKEDMDMDGWELRAAPLGPDPLHHHGGNPTP